ncbi:MAG: ferritin [Chryseobacterium sp.]|nr:MAG: ferritin [Chryseobacterium sp.]
MNTKRLSEKMEAALSEQMNNEMFNSQIYLSYGIWADDQGYSGVANLLWRHSQEERDHMIKFMNYTLNRGGKPQVSAIRQPGEEPKSLKDCFEKIFKYEVQNTENIYKIVDLAFEEKDWASWNFLQWFVKEQIEEETLAMDFLDKLEIAGGDRAKDESLLELDKMFGQMADEAELARDTDSENP